MSTVRMRCNNIIQWYLSLILHLDSYGYFMLKLFTYLYYLYIKVNTVSLIESDGVETEQASFQI